MLNLMSKVWLVSIVAACLLSSQVLAQSQPSTPAPSPPMQAADALFQAKKWDEAAKSYAALTKAEPANAPAWFGLGMSLYSMNKFTEAAAVFEKANETGKGTRIGRLALYNIAASYARAGDQPKALDSLTHMIALNPLFAIGITTDTDFDQLRADPRFKELALTVEKTQKPCMYEAGYRQFDFFMGDWDVFVQGRKVGESHTKVLQQGCIVEENWVTPVQTGQSFNFYNPVTKKWHQSYMDSNGGNYMMDGEYKEGALRYEGFIYSPAGQIPVRMTFFNLEPGKLRQTSETSSDGGKTWVQGWDGLYIRQKSDTANK